MLVAGAVISAQLAKPKAKSKSKDKGKGAGAPDETSQLKCRKTRLPTIKLGGKGQYAVLDKAGAAPPSVRPSYFKS